MSPNLLATQIREPGPVLIWGRMGDLPGAEKSFREALAIWREELGPEHQYTLKAMNSLGAVLSGGGKFAEAETLLRQALAGQRRQLGDSSTDAAITRRNLGLLLHRTGRLEEAEQVLRRRLRPIAGNCRTVTRVPPKRSRRWERS